jgi:3-phosphoshikimate 1-carboxyvinyltransferase
MIDEYPILGIAAAFAEGRTVMRGLQELRVKESDRLAAMAQGLEACGVKAAIDGDDLIVDGNGEPPDGGAEIGVKFDHRIAMSFLVMGLASRLATRIDDSAAIETSFPGFVALMNAIGADIGPT